MIKNELIELFVNENIVCDISEINLNISECKKFLSKMKNYYKYSNLKIDNMNISEILHRYEEYMKLPKSCAITLDKFKAVFSNDFKFEYYKNYCKIKTSKFDPLTSSKLSHDACKKESFILKYGDEIGESKFLDHRKSKGKSLRLEYWLNKGFSENEAKEKLKARQAVGSKENFIKRHGYDDGIKRWQLRQNMWQKTMRSKPAEEIARINKLKGTSQLSKFKNGSFSTMISKAENELCGILNGVSQFLLENEKSFYLYDINIGNKIIEYNGDYWHANPKIYNEFWINKNNKLTALQIWERDRRKLEFAESKGYKVLTIWESDWKNNKNECIEECMRFLND